MSKNRYIKFSQRGVLPKLLYCLSIFLIGIGLAGAGYASELNEGVKLYGQKRYREALTKLESYLKREPNSVYASYYAALCYQYLGQTSRALPHYRKVVAVAPQSKIASYSIGILQKLDPTFVAPKPKGSIESNESKPNSKGKKKKKNEKRKRDKSGDVIPNVARIHKQGGMGPETIPVKINGRQIWMILDTGAPLTTFFSTDLYKLSMSRPKRKYDGYSGGVDLVNRIGFWNIPVTIQVGPIIKKDFDIQVFDTRGTRPLLGQDFYKEFDYTKDSDSIIFTKKGYYKNVVSSGNSIPFTFNPKGDRIVVDIKVKGHKHPVILDTGNTAAGIHFHSAHQANVYGLPIPPGASLSRVIGAGGSGAVYSYASQNAIELGPISRRSVRVTVNAKGDFIRALTEKARLEKLAQKAKEKEKKTDSEEEEEEDYKFDDFLPLLGQDFLSRNRYTIDMENKRIHFSRH